MNRPYIIAIDFDGTICDSGWPDITKAELIESTILKMQSQIDKNPNTSFILWTCRTGKEFVDAVKFCKDNGIPIDYFNENHPSTEKWFDGYSVVMPEGKLKKIFANEYWDDRAVYVGV